MLPWDLEDWLTNEGDKVVHKGAAADSDDDSLNPSERLLYEVWLFDAEQRNGGVAQYFGNHGLEQWQSFSRIATPVLPSFAPFAAKVNAVIGRSRDPYLAVINSDVDLDALYREYQVALVTELRSSVRPAG